MAMQQKRRHAKRRTNKAKICRFCENHVNYIDFKDGEQLRRFQLCRKQLFLFAF